jgi:hypothetical protein
MVGRRYKQSLDCTFVQQGPSAPVPVAIAVIGNNRAKAGSGSECDESGGELHIVGVVVVVEVVIYELVA